MELTLHSPNGFLNQYIDSIILYTGYSGKGNQEILLPDGFAQLIVSLDSVPRIYFNQSKPILLSKSWITGIHTLPIAYKTEINASSLCIRFTPLGLQQITQIPHVEFSNQIVDASLLFPNIDDELIGPLRTLKNPNQRIKKAEVFLRHYLAHSPTALEFVTHALYYLSKDLSVKQTAEQLGISQKHLIHHLKKSTGLAPKAYQKLIRFNRSLAQLQNSQSSLTELAYRLNYTDQAHFIHDFKSHTGLTPNNYLKQSKEYPHVLSF